jgi:hypothetical protein
MLDLLESYKEFGRHGFDKAEPGALSKYRDQLSATLETDLLAARCLLNTIPEQLPFNCADGFLTAMEVAQHVQSLVSRAAELAEIASMVSLTLEKAAVVSD